MKRRRFSIAVITIAFASIMGVQAQTEKGRFLVGGSGNLNFTSMNTKWKTDYGSGDYGKSVNFEINAQAGYFIFKNCAAGLLVPYSHLKETDADEGFDFSYMESSINLIPFLSVYFGNSKFKPFIYGGIGPGKGSTKYYVDGPRLIKTPVKVLAYEAGAGLALFINQSISVDLGLGYASARKRWEDHNTKMKWESTDKGFGATIGFSFYL